MTRLGMTSSDTESFFVHLPVRGVVSVTGEDRFGFLQRLVSNDMTLLDTQEALYACLLTPQGKFLHDFFISQEGETVRLECEGLARAHDLHKRLERYRLRSDVSFCVQEDVSVYAGFGNKIPPSAYQDPRHVDMGWRSFVKPKGLQEKPFEMWDRHRIALEIADGSRDAVLERSTLEELNIVKHHGVSYTKGCYVGQELTARVENRGLAKKHLKMVHTHESDDTRSSCGDIGLALVRD